MINQQVLENVMVKKVICTTDRNTSFILNKENDQLWSICFETPIERSSTLTIHIHMKSLDHFSFYLMDKEFASQMWNAAKEGFLTDVTFLVQNKKIKAHKAVVSARCPNMILNGETVSISDSSIDDWIDFLYFLYTGQILRNPTQTLYYLAVKYEVKGLQLLLQSYSMTFGKDFNHNFSSSTTASFPIIGNTVLKPSGILLCYSRALEMLNIQEECRMDLSYENEQAFLFSSDKQKQYLEVELFSLLPNHLEATHKVFLELEDDFPTIKQLNPKKSKDGLDLFSTYIKPMGHCPKGKLSILVYLHPISPVFEFKLVDKNLLIDYGTLLHQIPRRFSNVKIVIRDSVFQAHWSVLAARVPYYANMFRSGMLEVCLGKIFVSDTLPEVFEEFLHYIYTGTVRKCCNYQQLYEIATKYLVDILMLLLVPKFQYVEN